jgi:hypothetical protein
MSRFPAGSKVTRAGDGRYVVSAPAGAPAAPGAVPAAAPAVDPASVAGPLPQNIGMEGDLASIAANLIGGGQLANLGRSDAATQLASELTGQGFFEQSSPFAARQIAGRSFRGIDPDAGGPLEAPTYQSGPDTAYSVTGVSPGRAYRGAWTGVKNQLGAMGSGEGSAVRDATADATRDLDVARQSLIDRFARGQNQSFIDQGEAWNTGMGQYRTGAGAYTDWQAGQQVPTTPAALAPPRLPAPPKPPDPYGLAGTTYAPTGGTPMKPGAWKGTGNPWAWKPKPPTIRRVRRV